MNDFTDPEVRDYKSRGHLGIVFRFLASAKLAVVLFVGLAIVLAVATILETKHGTAYSQWYVYHSVWFLGLLCMLGVNSFCAAAIRFPWKRHQTGFVVTHAGLLILLAGSMQSFLGGIEGHVSLAEGETATSLTLPRLSQITAVWAERPGEPPYEFTFESGPVDWSAGKTLDIGEVDGVRARILRFIRHAKPVEEWIAGDAQTGGPLVKFKMSGPDGTVIADHYLADEQFGDALLVGPIRLQLQRATTDRMLDDFVSPPTDELGDGGLLLMYYKDTVERVPVQDNVGKQITLGDTGVSVEISTYLPNARPDRMGQFTTNGDQPRNPLVELRVHVPGETEPQRQIASAKEPLLNMDGVYGRVCPVKFIYLHPAVTPSTGVELLQTSDGKLHSRVCAEGRFTSRAEISSGDRIKLHGNFELSIVQYMPRATRKISFEPAKVTARKQDEFQPAALVEITADGVARQAWLQRSDADIGFNTIDTPQGRLNVRYGYGKIPLGFSLKLVDFRRQQNPGGAGDAALFSDVQVVDDARRVDQQYRISMNEPLTHGRFTFYQSSFSDDGHGHEASVLRVAYDPGRVLKYVGSLMICMGIAIMFYMRAYSASHNSAVHDSESPSAPRKSAMRRAAAVFVMLLLPATSSFAETTENIAVNWEQWRELPVQNGGRHKPLDTLAWETLRLTSNRGNFHDGETGRQLDPTVLYLSMFFDWQGWDHPQREQMLLVTDWRPGYFHLHQADKWDHAPLLRIDFLELRTALGLPKDQKYVSPAQLNAAKIDDARSDRSLPFGVWITKLAELDEAAGELTELEKKGLELASRLWLYQNQRMGRAAKVLPVTGSESAEWMPLGHLMLTKFDDANDPSGRLRTAQRLLRQVRDSFRNNDAAAFNQTSAELLTTLKSLGPDLGEYPAAKLMTLEVAYNRWAPFRFAWVLVLAALIGMLLHLGSKWKPLYVAALTAYGAGLAALLAGFAMRIAIAGRPPVSNMYESVIYVGAGVALFGLIFELIYRQRYILTAAAAVSTVALVLADNCPTILDPSVRPLEPVLRSNFWLVTHVMTITLSFAAFALALGIANITLGYFCFRSSDRAAINSLSRFTYQAIQAGVLLLAAGTVLGGMWADYTWGRFWGWDPKEVWALIALLGYLAVLHARCAGWVGHRGLAALAVGCFSLAVMAWYGVNFVLGAGLHSYGFGGGGALYVLSAVLLQLLFASTALIRSRSAFIESPALTPDATDLHRGASRWLLRQAVAQTRT
jgi:ABC-type transport system involved in cytochrome c biogenesis permease subunit